MKHNNQEITEIFLLTDYRSQFYFSTKYRGASVDIERLKQYFKEKGFLLTVKNFSEINFREESYEGKYIIFNSSEDPQLQYKGYIEDILLGLCHQGAILIPCFNYFRAHQNKVFMEIIRDTVLSEIAGNIVSKVYGTYEDYYKDFSNNRLTEELVIKPDFGTRGKGVRLLKTNYQKKHYPFWLSMTHTFHNMKWSISRFLTGTPYTRQSNNRKKFIIQNFIDGIDGDFRVIVYFDKFYVLFRRNRKGDFRASGSGDFDFNVVLPDGLLDFSSQVFLKLDVPYASFDIGHKNGEFFLFEFQLLCLGQLAFEKSSWFYQQNSHAMWEKKHESPDLEREISYSIINFIKK